MEILLWLVPAALVTLVAMVWVTWAGRESRREIDRDEAVAKMAKALSKDLPPKVARSVPAPPRDRSTGVAVRPSRAT